MSDTFLAYEGKMAEFKGQLRYVDGASGMAVAVGKKIVAVDLFDKVSTCRKVWDRLLTGYVLDALEADAEQGQAEAADVERLLGTANATALAEGRHGWRGRRVPGKPGRRSPRLSIDAS